MHTCGIGLHHRLITRPRRGFGLAQAIDPRRADGRALHGGIQLGQRRFDVAVDGYLRLPVLAVVVNVDVDQSRVLGEHRRLSEVQAEIEKDADQDDEVGFAQGLSPGAREKQRMVRRQHSAGHAVDGQGHL